MKLTLVKFAEREPLEQEALHPAAGILLGLTVSMAFWAFFFLALFG